MGRHYRVVAMLNHLCTIERDANAGTLNGVGAQASPDWQPHLSGLLCHAWTTGGREQLDATTSVVVEDMRLIVELGTDVNEQDRINGVTDPDGNPIISGLLGIRAVIGKADHLELMLVRIS